MMFEDVLINYNSKWVLQRNKGILEVFDNRIQIEHPQYSRELPYSEIEAFLLKSGILVKLNDGNYYKFNYPQGGEDFKR